VDDGLAGEFGHDSGPRRARTSACRDLNLSYALADVSSPDLPIFGQTAEAAAAAAAAAVESCVSPSHHCTAWQMAGVSPLHQPQTLDRQQQHDSPAARSRVPAATLGGSGQSGDAGGGADNGKGFYSSFIQPELPISTTKDDMHIVSSPCTDGAAAADPGGLTAGPCKPLMMMLTMQPSAVGLTFGACHVLQARIFDV